MVINLTKQDNEIIIRHLYEFNKGVEITMKMAMDTYVNSIEFLENDIIFQTTIINPILDESCDITEKNVTIKSGKVGEKCTISLSEFDKPYCDIFRSAIREIKLNKLL